MVGYASLGRHEIDKKKSTAYIISVSFLLFSEWLLHEPNGSESALKVETS